MSGGTSQGESSGGQKASHVVHGFLLFQRGLAIANWRAQLSPVQPSANLR
jgi:hypothetical protein